MSRLRPLLFSIIVIIFLAISLKLLTKDPSIFPDETVLADLSYSFVSPKSFGKLPFDGKFFIIEKVSWVHNPYPILYHLLLMLPLKLFYSVTTVRLVPVIFGLFSLFFIYQIIKKLTKNPYLALLGMFLLAIDMNFLRCARFGRTDSAALFFNLWLIYLYISNKKIFPMIIVSILGIFTHLMIGSIATIAIIGHLIISRVKPSKLIMLSIILTIIISIIIITLNSMGIDVKNTTIGAHLIPTFHSTKLIIGDKFTYNLANYLIYFAGLAVFLIFSKKDKNSWFWFTYCLVSLFIIFIGNSFFYIFYVPVTFIVLLVISDIKDAWGIILKWTLVGGLLIMSLYQHSKIIDTYKNYSYYALGDSLNTCVKKQNANLIIGQMVPDPYFYFIEKRPDSKLSYGNMNNYEDSFTYAFSKADYFIYPALYEQILTNADYQKAQEDPTSKIQIDQYLKTQFGAEPKILDLLKKYKKDVCIVKSNGYYPDLAVFSFR